MKSFITYMTKKTNSEHPQKNTQMCRHWKRGFCVFGSNCNFAHGLSELKKRGKNCINTTNEKKEVNTNTIVSEQQLKQLEKKYSTEIENAYKEYKEFQTKAQTYSVDAANQTDVTNQARLKKKENVESEINYVLF